MSEEINLNLADLALDQVKEIKPVEPGDHEVKCLKIFVASYPKEGSTKDSVKVSLQCELADDVNKEIDTVYGFLWWPHPDDDYRQKQKKLKLIRDAILCFGGDINDSRITQLEGLTGMVTIGTETYQGKERAVVREFLAPEEEPPVG